MRGLGFGIIVTTVVLSFVNNKEKLSNAEIITQARGLGMVMKEEETDDNLKQVLEKSLDKDVDSVDTDDNSSDLDTNNQDTAGEDATEGDTAVDGVVDVDTTNEDTTDVDTTEEDKTDIEDNNKEDDFTQDEPSHTITFTIYKGMSSSQVSELLKQNGLIEDAVDFDNYIKRKGKAGVIRIGVYTLPKDAEYNVILNTIVG